MRKHLTWWLGRSAKFYVKNQSLLNLKTQMRFWIAQKKLGQKYKSAFSVGLTHRLRRQKNSSIVVQLARCITSDFCRTTLRLLRVNFSPVVVVFIEISMFMILICPNGYATSRSLKCSQLVVFANFSNMPSSLTAMFRLFTR